MFCPEGVGHSFIILSIQFSATETNYYSITKDTYDAVTIEGIERGWPLPPE